jgi:histidyl-tRNA synthetase
MLKLCAEACGFAPEEHDKVFIILDKMDKIGLEGVKNELIAEGYDEACVSKYIALYDGCDTVTVEEFASNLGDVGTKIASDLSTIMRCASAATVGGCKLAFDPTLVRGMSYYTGTIFEIRMDGYGYSVGGGGRYDEMLGKFMGQKVPACGFSLGFERIVSALSDSGFVPPSASRSVAFLASKNMREEDMLKMYSDAAALRSEGVRVLVTAKMKNVYFQKTKLSEEGYSEFVEY